MKSFYLATVLAVALLSCSKLEVADDPILGIWTSEAQQNLVDEDMGIDTQEWIFNDLYKGRYHGYKNGQLVYKMDYRWSVDEGNYLLEYNAGPLEAMNFTMRDDALINNAGIIVASRE